MENLRRILTLTTLTVLLTVGLFTFAVITKDNFAGQEMLGCGTVDMANDVVYLNDYDIPLDHPGLVLFQANCKACHRLDQKLVGPALRNSFETRDSIWFVNMIISANGLIENGDTSAVRLFNEYNQTQHPDFKAFDKQHLTDLVNYLRLEGQRDN